MTKQKRGFALLSKERLREIASAGGKRAHELGKAHEFKKNSTLAREAGAKGGSSKNKRYSLSSSRSASTS